MIIFRSIGGKKRWEYKRHSGLIFDDEKGIRWVDPLYINDGHKLEITLRKGFRPIRRPSGYFDIVKEGEN